MAVVTTLHTVAYLDHKGTFNRIKEFVPVFAPGVEKQLGPLHERALDDMEEGRMRDDEFQQLRQEMRQYGMRDMWY